MAGITSSNWTWKALKKRGHNNSKTFPVELVPFPVPLEHLSGNIRKKKKSESTKTSLTALSVRNTHIEQRNRRQLCQVSRRHTSPKSSGLRRNSYQCLGLCGFSPLVSLGRNQRGTERECGCKQALIRPQLNKDLAELKPKQKINTILWGWMKVWGQVPWLVEILPNHEV